MPTQHPLRSESPEALWKVPPGSGRPGNRTVPVGDGGLSRRRGLPGRQECDQNGACPLRILTATPALVLEPWALGGELASRGGPGDQGGFGLRWPFILRMGTHGGG